VNSADADRGREPWARGSRLLGVLLVVAGVIVGYSRRVVFHDAAFADRAALCLQDPRVSGFIAEEIADRAIAQKRDLLAFRPMIVGAARTVVTSEAFGAIFRSSTRAAHAAAFSQRAETLYLSLPDAGVLLRSALAKLDPDAVKRVPDDLSASLEALTRSNVGNLLARVLRAGHRLRGSGFALAGTGALLLAAGIVLSQDRRVALLRSGGALAVGAGFLFLAPTLVGVVLATNFAPQVRPLVRGLWDGFAGGLSAWALVLCGIGLVFAAAASSLASHVEIEDALRRAWMTLHRPARTRAGELLRAGALLACGLLAVLVPELTVRALTIALGGLLAFEGLRELFALVAPQLDAAADEAARRAQEAIAGARPQGGRSGVGGQRWLRYGLMALLAIAAVGAGVAFLRGPGSLPPSAAIAACNGSAALCDRRLDEVVLPGAHNAMSSADIPGWLFPNQERGMPVQLRHGIRALLFDVHYGVPVAERVKTEFRDEGNEKAKFERALGSEGFAAAMRIRDRLVGKPHGERAPYLCHGFCELGSQPLVPVLQQIRDFLVENPGEVLVIVIEDYVTPADIARAFEESGLERLVYRGPPRPPWPTLRRMIDSGQRVLVLAENEAKGVPWYHLAYEITEETPYTFHTPEEFSCKPNRGGEKKSFFLMNHWIETTPTPKPSNAEIVNQRAFLVDRARQCERERGKRPSTLAVDFALTGDVVGAAAELNGLTPGS
jgi:hypothetical protein